VVGVGLLVRGQDQAQVVDTGGFGEGRYGLGDLGMDVATEPEGDGIAGGVTLEVDGDPAQVLGVVAELDLAAEQGGIDLVAVVLLCRARHSRAYAEFRIMPSSPLAELVPSSREGMTRLSSSA